MNLVNMDWSNSSIGIVGNSTSTIDFSDEINSRDIVVRLNGGALPSNVSKGNVGTKTDVVVFNRCKIDGKHIMGYSESLIKETDEMYDYLESFQIPVLFTFRKAEPVDTNFINTFPPEIWEGTKDDNISTIGLLSREIYNAIYLKYGYKMPTTGLLIIVYILFLYKPKEIILYNFNFNGTHFFDDTFKDTATDSSYTEVKNTSLHNANLEINILKDLMGFYKNLRYAE